MCDGRRPPVLSLEDKIIACTESRRARRFTRIVITFVQIINTRNHDATATFRRFGSGDGLSRSRSAFALSGGAFTSGTDFDFFFIMTPLRDAFVGFFAGTGVGFGAATDVDSIAGTAGDVLTITFAATALYRGDTYGERVIRVL